MSDLIDRQKAIDALDELCDRECEYSKQQRSVMCGACHLGSAFDVIEQLPSEEPQERKGKWIHDGSHWANRWICDRCGYKLFGVKTNFCPNCGCKMEVDNERND